MTNPAPPVRPFWRADSLVDTALARFRKGREEGNEERQRDAYYLVTRYYARSLLLLRRAFEEGREPLAEAAIRNLLVLDAGLGGMHRDAPGVVPLALPLTEAFHDRFVRGLLLRILDEEGEAVSLTTLRNRVLEFGIMGEADVESLEDHVERLIRSGMIEERGERFRRAGRRGPELDTDAAILATVTGGDLARRLQQKGYEGIHDVADRAEAFIPTFIALSGFGGTVASGVVELARAFMDEQRATTATVWDVADLLGSGFPRPYQIEAFHVFRAHDYRQVVIEAPTGSGKTLIGMLCMQDWFRTLASGESMMVVVPTNSYQQQWFRELCFEHVGLQLAPELVELGSPQDLLRSAARGHRPPVVLVTYRGLGQLERNGALGRFLRSLGVRHIVLDEVHKVAGEPEGETARAVRTVVRETERGVESLIGFTGTAVAYREELEALDLRIVHTVPMLDLVASGYVAPFAEVGVPFSFSAREFHIRGLLSRLRELVHGLADRVGGEELRRRFRAIPMERRVSLATSVFEMYRGRPDAAAAVTKRLAAWENGESLKASEFDLLTMVQVVERASDRKMLGTSEESDEPLRELVEVRAALGAALEGTIFEPYLSGVGFGTEAPAIEPDAKRDAACEAELARTAAGLYGLLSDWFYRVGEGRVSAVRTILEAERAEREITGVIVFDRARRLDWKKPRVQPGFAGVSGLFAELLGDENVVAIAALASELYLPEVPDLDIAEYAADFVVEHLIAGDLGDALSDLILAGLPVHPRAAERVAAGVREQLTRYGHGDVDTHVETFYQKVARPLRLAWGHKQRGIPVTASGRIRRRLRRGYLPLRFLAHLAADYRWLSERVRTAVGRELIQSTGVVRTYSVVPMPSGRRRQLVYDLVAQLVDDPDAPTNAVIVSNWARTGWNVIRPNILIDATATRDVTAWQQLRGRAMRALRTWGNRHSLLLGRIVGLAGAPLATRDLSPDDLRLIRTVVRDNERARLRETGLSEFSPEERIDLGSRLVRRFNKVTHVYELVKASGSEPQIEFLRSEGRWDRREEIRAKHAHEISVDPVRGILTSDHTHAPLVFKDDPRTDPPSALRSAVADMLRGADARIVSGWMRAALDRANR